MGIFVSIGLVLAYALVRSARRGRTPISGPPVFALTAAAVIGDRLAGAKHGTKSGTSKPSSGSGCCAFFSRTRLTRYACGRRSIDMRLHVVAAIPLIIASCLTLRPPQAAARAPMACVQPDGVSALATGPGDTLLAGTAAGRVYRSRDGGHCFVALPAPPLPVGIGVLAVPPGHPSWIIAGFATNIGTAGQAYGLYRSEDGGRTWMDGTRGLAVRHAVPAQLVALADGTLVLAYGCPPPSYAPCAGGLARSADGGRTWWPVGPRGWAAQGVTAQGAGGLLALIISRAEPRGTGRVVRSSDGGRTWHGVGTTPGYPRAGIAFDVVPGTLVAPSWEPSLVVAGYGAVTLQAKVARSADAGRHWSFVAANLSRSTGGMSVVGAIAALGRSHRLLLSVYRAVYRSDDEGATWVPSSSGLVGDQGVSISTLFTAPDGKTVYAGNGNVYTDPTGHYQTSKGTHGLYRSDDGAATWAPNG